MLTGLYKILKRLFGRVFFLILSIVLQIVWFSVFLILLGNKYPFFAGAVRAISLIVVFWIVNKRVNPSYKLAWALLILSTPMIGFAVYLTIGRPRIGSRVEKNCKKAVWESSYLLKEDRLIRLELARANPTMNRQSQYLTEASGFPLYKDSASAYFAEGEQLYQAMVEKLKQAKRFIFLEFFIIDDGEMWSTILNILERKAREGLDVRLIYDDVGCVNTLPAKFYREVRERGIQCEVFNPFHPIISTIQNNRDHRKIMVIDGNIGFTGGINLADEYINRKMRFGHWKDTGVMLEGEAVWNFTVMFLQMWAVVTEDVSELQKADPFRPTALPVVHPAPASSVLTDAEASLLPDTAVPVSLDMGDPAVPISNHPDLPISTDIAVSVGGFIQPYSDTPLDEETVGEAVYLNIISQAKDYVYICTPYLIIDNEMMTALCLAAKGGIDVRIITPGIPDKRTIFLLSQSYFEQLIDSGVRIYEYTPGFLHAKSFVSDDEVATVGTINLDYRSLYLHFECGVWMYDTPTVAQVKEDFLSTMELSREVTKEECADRSVLVRLTQSVLRLLAPML